MFSASMSTKNINWRLWCRLCAKEDTTGNVNVLTENKDCQFEDNGYLPDLNLSSAIEKFFLVSIKHNEDKPKTICSECLSFITNLIYINERIAKVQEMFCIFLKNSVKCDEQNLEELKLNLGLTEENRKFPNVQQKIQPYSELHYFEESVFDDKTNQQNPLDRLCVEKNQQSQDSLYTDEFEVDKISKIENDERCAHSVDKLAAVEESSDSTDVSDSNKSSSKVEHSENITYRCLLCQRSFKRLNNFQIHMKRTHKKEIHLKSTQCSECQKTFKTQHQLKRHSITHLPSDKKKVFPCPYCGKTFSSNSLVQSHVQYRHNNERSFICEKCGIAVCTNVALKSHMLTHTDNSPFECEICKKCFKTERRLRLHKDTHESNKHICPECGLELSSRVTLNRHQLVHSDEMQHTCDYCGRAFKRAKALKNHLILHTGLKPYSCEFCDRTFANGSNCRTHKKKAHSEELAALESSGGSKSYTLNIPKLTVLRAITKNNDNLSPVVSKQSGCFAFGKKPKCCSKSFEEKELVSEESTAEVNTGFSTHTSRQEISNGHSQVIEQPVPILNPDKNLNVNGIFPASNFNLCSAATSTQTSNQNMTNDQDLPLPTTHSFCSDQIAKQNLQKSDIIHSMSRFHDGQITNSNSESKVGTTKTLSNHSNTSAQYENSIRKY